MPTRSSATSSADRSASSATGSVRARWYALRSKPHREEALWREAAARGFEVYYPRIRVQPVNPRARKIRPYFPGYVFVQADIQAAGHSALAYMPHSGGLVCCGSEPAPVPDLLIRAIRRRVGEGDVAENRPWSGFRRGDAVTIETGAFAGCHAIFDCCLSGRDRVRVLLQILSNQLIALHLPSGQICRTTPH
jgi:transcription antitermination factor NusG